MKAELFPLDGKYYGTEVSLEVDGDFRVVKFWLTFQGDGNSYVPSDRELELGGITREQWDNAEVVKNIDFAGESYFVTARDVVEACDHFEDQFSYLVAKQFVDAVNSGVITGEE